MTGLVIVAALIGIMIQAAFHWIGFKVAAAKPTPNFFYRFGINALASCLIALVVYLLFQINPNIEILNEAVLALQLHALDRQGAIQASAFVLLGAWVAINAPLLTASTKLITRQVPVVTALVAAIVTEVLIGGLAFVLPMFIAAQRAA